MAMSPAESLGQLRALMQSLTRRQQIIILAGAIAVAGTLWLFVRLIGKADFKPLFTGLSPGEAQAMARRLDEKRIPYELAADGTSLRVPADQLDKLRLEMAAQGLPHSGRLGFELFDKPNWVGSDFAEKVNYQRALEGELERTLQTLTDIAGVRVHLVMPHESIFTERERPAKASVVVKLRGGRLADESFRAITHLVASAVDGMPPENVTVVDVNGHVPLLARRNGPAGLGDGADELETALAEKIVATLVPVVGPERVKAKVTVEYELGTTDSTQETYDPNGAVLLTSQISEERTGETAPEGVPGTASNVPGRKESSAAAAESSEYSESQSQRTESKTFAVSKSIKRLVIPAGGVRRVNAAVLVDDAIDVKEENGQKAEVRRKRTPEEMKQIQELAAASIGIDATRGDRLAVENLSFLPLSVEPPAEPAGMARLAPYVERWVWIIRYLALGALFGLVYMLFLRPIKNQIVASIRQMALRPRAEAQPAVSLGGATEKPAVTGAEGALELEPSLQKELVETGSDVKQTVMLKRHLVDKIKKEPGAASRLIQNWIRQAEAGR